MTGEQLTLDGEGADNSWPAVSARIRTQRSILNSEIYWFGRPMGSHDIHTALDRPPLVEVVYGRPEPDVSVQVAGQMPLPGLEQLAEVAVDQKLDDGKY